MMLMTRMIEKMVAIRQPMLIFLRHSSGSFYSMLMATALLAHWDRLVKAK